MVTAARSRRVDNRDVMILTLTKERDEARAHRKQWRRNAWKWRDAAEALIKATGPVLAVGPVGTSHVVFPVGMRAELQEARNRAEAAISLDDVDVPEEQNAPGVHEKGEGNG